MINIAICDDEPADLLHIESLVREYFQQHPEQPVSVSTFHSSEDLLAQQEKRRFHIYLLDILMEKKSGIDVGRIIRQSDETAAILYLTVSPDYAVASYTVGAFYYLLKPVGAKELFPILERAIDGFENQADQLLMVRTKNGIWSVRHSQIMYVEYHSHIFSYYLSSGEVVDSITIRANFDQETEPLVRGGDFVKISSSFLVNLRYVEKAMKSVFLLKDGTELAVTRTYSDARRQYLDFLLKGVNDTP